MSLKEQLNSAILAGANKKVRNVLKQMSAQEVNEDDEYGETALHKACRRKNNPAVSLLIAKPGINVNVKDRNGRTPLHVACLYNNPWAVDQLLRFPGIRENAKDNDGRVPIMVATDLCSKEALGVMLKSSRVDLDVKDNLGRGLEESVGLRGRGEEKTKCLHMIRDEIIRRNERYIAILKEIRNDLAKDIEEMNINPSNDDGAKLEAARGTLECPVCFDTMKPPTRIWMCRNSHAICEICQAQLVRDDGGPHPPCPTCKSERVDQRALIAEKFAASVFN